VFLLSGCSPNSAATLEIRSIHLEFFATILPRIMKLYVVHSHGLCHRMIKVRYSDVVIDLTVHGKPRLSNAELRYPQGMLYTAGVFQLKSSLTRTWKVYRIE